MEIHAKSIPSKLSRVFLSRTPKERLTPREEDDVFYEKREVITYPPTEAQPGSEEKLKVLEERARHFLPLFHPLDGLELNRKLEEEICDGYILR